MNNAMLTTFLEASVNLRIAEYRQRGGPTAADFARVQEYVPMFCEHGDAFFFRQEGRSAEVANAVADALATLAFVPGGVHAFGMNFEVVEQTF